MCSIAPPPALTFGFSPYLWWAYFGIFMLLVQWGWRHRHQGLAWSVRQSWQTQLGFVHGRPRRVAGGMLVAGWLCVVGSGVLLFGVLWPSTFVLNTWDAREHARLLPRAACDAALLLHDHLVTEQEVLLDRLFTVTVILLVVGALLLVALALWRRRPAITRWVAATLQRG